MTLGTVLAAVGLRGLVGAAVGAALMATPAYQAGRWVEAAAAGERLARILAERERARLEDENERIARAIEARRAALRASPRDGGGGGVPDDGYRRD